MDRTNLRRLSGPRMRAATNLHEPIAHRLIQRFADRGIGDPYQGCGVTYRQPLNPPAPSQPFYDVHLRFSAVLA